MSDLSFSISFLVALGTVPLFFCPNSEFLGVLQCFFSSGACLSDDDALWLEHGCLSVVCGALGCAAGGIAVDEDQLLFAGIMLGD
jgi:hypothetical protein